RGQPDPVTRPADKWRWAGNPGGCGLALSASRQSPGPGRPKGGWGTLSLSVGKVQLSYASYLVWKELGGGLGWPLALPLGLYSVQLAVSWTVLILFFVAHSAGLALLHLLLLFGLVVSMALIWHPINKLAALLLLPYLAWLTVTTSITYRLWRDSLCPGHQPRLMGEKND
uniref:Translocator protein n=1 Tax=Sus scrofa TaxID=9823 RepID=A0A8D0SQR6_PIG